MKAKVKQWLEEGIVDLFLHLPLLGEKFFHQVVDLDGLSEACRTEPPAVNGCGGHGGRGPRVDISGMGHDQGPQMRSLAGRFTPLIGPPEKGIDQARQILAACGIEPAGPGRLAHLRMTDARRPKQIGRKNKNRREEYQKTHGGHENDAGGRQCGIFPNGLADFKPVRVGYHGFQKDEVGGVIDDKLKRGFTATGSQYRVTALFQEEFKGDRGSLLVVRDKNTSAWAGG